MKELIRKIVFPFMPGWVEARFGTAKYKAMAWLYGDPGEELQWAIRRKVRMKEL